MTTERSLRSRNVPETAPSTPIVPPKAAEHEPSRGPTSTEAEMHRMSEQLKEKAHVVGEQLQSQAKSTIRSVVDELRFIKQKFFQTRARDHILQLGATWIVVTMMHVFLNSVSGHLPFSTNLFVMYLSHWQPWSFVIGNTILSRSIDHLRSPQQYAWAVTAMCWLSAVVGWTSFPFGGVLEKAALSLPLNARNFVWLSAIPVVINWTVKKIRQF